MTNETSAVVTQEEAQSFFQRVATMAVGYSAQANRIEDMAREVASLSERISAMAEEQRKLRSEVAETWDFAHRMEQERDNARAEITTVTNELGKVKENLGLEITGLQGQLSEAHDAMVARDQRIAEQDRTIVELRQALQDKEIVVSDLKVHNEAMQNDRNYWAKRAQDTESVNRGLRDELAKVREELGGAQAKLSTVEAKVAEFRSLFEPKPEPTPVVPEPQPQTEEPSQPAPVAVNW